MYDIGADAKNWFWSVGIRFQRFSEAGADVEEGTVVLTPLEWHGVAVHASCLPVVVVRHGCHVVELSVAEDTLDTDTALDDLPSLGVVLGPWLTVGSVVIACRKDERVGRAVAALAQTFHILTAETIASVG